MCNAVKGCLVLLVMFAVSTNVKADALQSASEISGEKIRAAEQSQQKINLLADESDAMLQQYRATLRQSQRLAIYNEQLSEQIRHQLEQIEEMQQSTAKAKVMGREIPSLLKDMIDEMETFVESDLPFHLQERRERVQFLRNNIQRSDVSIAEKFRQVLEAYRIELEYGQKLDSYQATVELFNVRSKTTQPAREVNVLRIGRIALLCQTQDGKITGAWNPELQRWQQLDDSVLAQSINKGLRITRNQAAIDLLTIPLFVAELQQGAAQ